MISLRRAFIAASISPLLWAVTTRAFVSKPPPVGTVVGCVPGTSCRRGVASSLPAARDANMSEEERDAAMEKALKAMTAFSNKYIENTGTYYCSDMSVPAVVIKGLAEHKVTLGTPLCPCRFYEDKEKEAQDGYWNW
jgi:hypothetical protein